MSKEIVEVIHYYSKSRLDLWDMILPHVTPRGKALLENLQLHASFCTRLRYAATQHNRPCDISES
jgi:hypothetical protein